MPRKTKKKNLNKKKFNTSQRSGPKGTAKIIDRLYLSGEHFAKDHERLISLGITDIVACGCPSHFPNSSFQYMEIHLRDSSTANVNHYLEPAADFIAESLQRGGTVLVHCKAGICRSATMIAAYLLKYQRNVMAPTLEDALAVIRLSRPCANPRNEFQEALRQFLHQLLWKEEHQIDCRNDDLPKRR